ncbi:hypothetical protein MH117_21170 [Paenibacillus sp. ACRRX]|uniref:hypothetical protein n=1 Tax=Paenibacillus sp. ACRRX TaxID=2918206 RepID=UPI001EF4A814|nr:hypothetical protein [Paenibacillus sp. ACRRX]MCG7409924.1 hypothetical protein [Paenibacillus sp. ACRRX]
MNPSIVIPRGEEKVTVELTVKEALALSGQRFNDQPQVKSDATRKLKHAIDRKFEV